MMIVLTNILIIIFYSTVINSIIIIILVIIDCTPITCQEYIISNPHINCRGIYDSLAHFLAKEKSFKEVKELVHNHS